MYMLIYLLEKINKLDFLALNKGNAKISLEIKESQVNKRNN